MRGPSRIPVLTTGSGHPNRVGVLSVRKQRWIAVADSPFLPPHGGGEREHAGFVRAAFAQGLLALLIVPSKGPLELDEYEKLLPGVPVVEAPRRTGLLRLAHPTVPYVVASRPPQRDLVEQASALAPDASGIVLFSYKSWRIGKALAEGLGLPAVLRQHNLEGAYHRSLARETPGPRGLVLWLESMRITRDERRLELAPWLSAVADISAHDAEQRRDRGAPAVHVPPFAFDARLAALSRHPDQRHRVLFLGALDVATNTAALDWLLTGPWPAIVAQVPHATLDVVGRGPSRALRAKLEQQPGVVLHADVPDIHPFLTSASVAVNPAVAGSGVNIKLVDYLQAGIPVVSTTLGSQGLRLTAGADLEVQDQPEAFAAAVTALLRDPVRAEEMGVTGRRTIAAMLDPAANIRRLRSTLESSPS
jgi:glycosyltransferase involved in cell wall biosynthesis